jgi:hypothetical protein
VARPRDGERSAPCAVPGVVLGAQRPVLVAAHRVRPEWPQLDERTREALIDAAADGSGLWIVAGHRAPEVVPGGSLTSAERALEERSVAELFGAAASKVVVDEARPALEVIVPVRTPDPVPAFRFHPDDTAFAGVARLRRVDRRVEVLEGSVDPAMLRLVRRRVPRGPVCGLLVNELGACAVVPAGEAAPEVRAHHVDRYRSIVDGLRDLQAAAAVVRERARILRDASQTGWVLDQPVANAFVHAVHPERARSVPTAQWSLSRRADRPADPDRAGSVTEDEPTEASGEVPTASVDQPSDLSARRRTTGGGGGEVSTRSLAVLARRAYVRPRGATFDPARRYPFQTATVLVADGGSFEVLQGAMDADLERRLDAAIDDGDVDPGNWGVFTGPFRDAMVEQGAPTRAIEPLTSATSFAHLLDGAASLDDAARRLDALDAQLQRLASEGWTLAAPISGFWLRLRSPRIRSETLSWRRIAADGGGRIGP